MTKSTKIVAALGVVAGLGIAALPLGSFAASKTANVEVELTVTSAINISSDKAKCAAELGPKATTTCLNKISYSTNNATGMTLTVKDADSTTALVNEDDETATIAAGDGAVAAGTAKWNITGGSLTNKAVTTAAQTIATSNGPVDTSVNMTYNFATASSTKSGVYSDIITYTATTN